MPAITALYRSSGHLCRADHAVQARLPMTGLRCQIAVSRQMIDPADGLMDQSLVTTRPAMRDWLR